MRTIEWTTRFKKDYKREKKGHLGPKLDELLEPLITQLANDQALDVRHRDHALTGDWIDFRDCHVRPDLVLIYRKPSDDVLQLVRLGSHSELSL